ncbi:GntR family transcriptional regulator of vanillate catabolism [Rhodobacter sp. 140A]|nr:GntR family transcriptional regulator of vanillate catabolism [Rhodobacter sp. 140A]
MPQRDATLNWQGPATSQTERALVGLRDLIVSGEIPVGGRVSEIETAARLNLSRTPLRAALQRLHEEGLLEALPARGYAVRGFSLREIGEAIEIRGMLEGLCVRQLAERGCAAALLAQMEDGLDAIDDLLVGRVFTAADLPVYIAANARFHELLLVANGSALIAQEVERAGKHPFAGPSALVQLGVTEGEVQRHLITAQDQHRAVLEAIRNHESARAEAVMREHARMSLRNLRRVLRDGEGAEALKGIRGATLIRREEESLRP